jgi:hypothetical protein
MCDCCRTNVLCYDVLLLACLCMCTTALNYHVMRATPLSFISKYMTECGSTVCEAQLVNYLLELTLLDTTHDTAAFPPR